DFDCEPRPAPLAIEVHAQRVHRPPAGVLLPGVEPAEEEAGAGRGGRERERARRGELVLERLPGELVGVVRGPRGARYLPTDLALPLAREVGGAVAEVLRDGRPLLRHDAVVEPLPAGVPVEALALEDGLRLVGGAARGGERD